MKTCFPFDIYDVHDFLMLFGYPFITTL